MSGKRGLSMKALDKLAEYLDLHVTKGNPKRGKK